MLETDRAGDIGALAVASTVPVSGRFDGEMSLPQGWPIRALLELAGTVRRDAGDVF